MNSIKEQIKKVMIDHLKETIHYPKCNDEQILQELKPMWVKLEEAGLIQPGMNFNEFQHQAMFQLMIRKISG